MEAEVLVHKLVVDLIGDNVHVLFQDDIRQGFELMSCVSGSGRVGGIVEDKSLCCRRNGGFEFVRCQDKTVFFSSGNDNGFSLCQRDSMGVSNPVGGRNNDLIALVDKRLDKVIKGTLCS